MPQTRSGLPLPVQAHRSGSAPGETRKTLLAVAHHLEIGVGKRKRAIRAPAKRQRHHLAGLASPGIGFNNVELIQLKIVVFAPMPSASVRIAIAAYPGVLAIIAGCTVCPARTRSSGTPPVHGRTMLSVPKVPPKAYGMQGPCACRLNDISYSCDCIRRRSDGFGKKGESKICAVHRVVSAAHAWVRVGAAPMLHCMLLPPSAAVADAARADDLPAVHKLIKEHADVNAPAKDGSSALLWAAFHSDAEMTKALLAAGAWVDAPNHYGVTPLLQASRNGDVEVMRALLDAGADPTRWHRRGRDAADGCVAHRPRGRR